MAEEKRVRTHAACPEPAAAGAACPEPAAAGTSSSWQPPQGAHAPTRATARLHAAALCGLLWHAECQHAAAAAQRAGSGAHASTSAPRQQRPPPEQVPDAFASVAQYVSVFEPLLHEEARGGLVKEYEEARAAGRGWRVAAEGVEQRPGGWFSATLSPMPARQGAVGTHGEAVRKDSVLVLCKAQAQAQGGTGEGGGPAQHGPAASDAGRRRQAQQLRVACIVRRGALQGREPLGVDLHPACPHHDTNDWACPCMRVRGGRPHGRVLC